MSAPRAGAADAARARQVELILEGVGSLPTLSPVAAKLLNAGSSADTDINEVVKILETDPALASRMLALCRRADRGLGDRIKTVRHATVMLGLDAVRAAALSVSVYDLMSSEAVGAGRGMDEELAGDDPGGAGAFDQPGFWKHSIGVACCAEIIASQARHLGVQGEEAFLAGLLHDLGKLVLRVVLPRAYGRVIRLAEVRACDAAPVERELLGLDNHTAGKRIAEHWGLPEDVRDAVWLHSRPLESIPRDRNRDLIAVVTLAKALCRELHLGWSCDYGPGMSAARLWSELRLSGKGPHSIVGPLQAAVADRLKVLGLDADASPPALLLESLSNANRRLSRLNAVLNERARQGQARAGVLDAVASFQREVSRARGVGEVLSNVAQSAASLIGDGFYAALFQPGPAEAWQLFRFGPQRSVEASHVLGDPPGKRGQQWALASLTDATQMSMAMLGLLPWLSEFLADAPDLRKLRLLPITGTGAGGRGFGPAAVLVNDRELADGEFTPSVLAPLIATWSGAVQATWAREEARRLGERLADASRSLAEAQEALTRRESMARLGEMTAGAAHEMNNPLTIISGRAQLLGTRLPEGADRDAARAIADAAASLASLIAALHDLSAPVEARREPVDLAAAGARAGDAASRRLGSRVNVAWRGTCPTPGPTADASLITSILTELLVNAAQAAPEKPVVVSYEPGPGGRGVLRVTDDGPGFSTRALRHAFDPFFSERSAGRGHGLGLTRVRHWAEAMGVDISVENGPKGGGVATIRFPGAVENSLAA